MHALPATRPQVSLDCRLLERLAQQPDKGDAPAFALLPDAAAALGEERWGGDPGQAAASGAAASLEADPAGVRRRLVGALECTPRHLQGVVRGSPGRGGVGERQQVPSSSV